MDIKKVLFSLSFVAVFGLYVIYNHANTSVNNSLLTDSNQPVSSLPPVTTDQNSIPTPTPKSKPAQVGFKNGTFTGNSADAYYGLVQVQAVISGGRLTNINFLDYPRDNGNSLSRSNYALPQLKSEAIQSQSANVNVISGATATSDAFAQSLSSALSQAS